MCQTTARLSALLLAVATALPAQSSRQTEKGRQARERAIELRAERLARTIEKTVEASVDGAMRSVEAALANVDRLYQDNDWRQNFNSHQSWQGRMDTTFAFGKDGVLELTTFGGDVVVTGSSGQEARIRGLTERGTRWRVSSSRITIEAEGYRGRSRDSQYEITVPRGVRVILRSMNGDLTVRGVSGEVDLHTNNGDVEVSDAVGRAELVTLSGDVAATRVRGDVEATSLNGTVALTDVQGGTVTAESTNGSVELANVVASDIDASTISGEVDFSGPIDPRGRYAFASHSGSVSLTIPGNASARFSIETFNGEIDSDFPITLRPNRDRRRGQKLEFNVGAGEARVTAESFSGSIVIRRAAPRR